MTKTWLDKLCDPLENPKYPQITGSLIRYDSNDKIIGKCAEGEIACQNKIGVSRYQEELESGQILQLGVPEDLAKEGLPFYWSYNKEFDFDNKQTNSIGQYIWKLNDAGLNYKEIVDFLRTTFEDAV